MSGLLKSPTVIVLLSVSPFMSVSVCLGEGNGTPLQYSCLENPMDGGAWSAVQKPPGTAPWTEPPGRDER